MTRYASVFIATFTALALTATADAAQRTRAAKPPPPPPPPPFRVEVPTKPMAMTRLANTIPAGSQIGKAEEDCGVVALAEGIESFFGKKKNQDDFGKITNDDTNGTIPIYLEHAIAGVPQQDYANVFNAQATELGYTLPSQTAAGSLF